MTKSRRLAVGLVMAAMLAAAGLGAGAGAQEKAATQPASAPAVSDKPLLEKPVTVTIFATGDMHEKVGKLPRIAGFVRQFKKADPNVLFVDDGDFLDDSAGTVGDAAVRGTNGKAMFEIMSAAGYDVVNLGNHDYKLGKDALLDLFAAHPKVPLAAANVAWSDADKAKLAIPTHKVFTFGAFRLAVVPLASRYPNHVHGEPLPISDEGTATYKRMLPELRRTSDAVVLMSHLFDYHDKRLFVPDSDDAPAVMIGAHDHKALVRRTGRALQVRAGALGNCLAQITLRWDGRQTTASARLHDYKAMGAWPEDPDTRAAVDKYLKPAPAPKK